MPLTFMWLLSDDLCAAGCMCGRLPMPTEILPIYIEIMVIIFTFVKVFHGQEPPSGESTTTECGVNYQLHAVITELAQSGTPRCSRPQPATDNGVRDGRSNWLVAPNPYEQYPQSSTYCTVLSRHTNRKTCCTNRDSYACPRVCQTDALPVWPLRATHVVNAIPVTCCHPFLPLLRREIKFNVIAFCYSSGI